MKKSCLGEAETTVSGSDNFLITHTEILLMEIIITNYVSYVHRLFSEILEVEIPISEGNITSVRK